MNEFLFSQRRNVAMGLLLTTAILYDLESQNCDKMKTLMPYFSNYTSDYTPFCHLYHQLLYVFTNWSGMKRFFLDFDDVLVPC